MGSTRTISSAVAAATLVSSSWVTAAQDSPPMPTELEALFEAPPPAPKPEPPPRKRSRRVRRRPPRVG